MKIRGLGFPRYLTEHGHISVTGMKEAQSVSAYMSGLRLLGFKRFTFVNDNIVQLRDAYDLAPAEVTPVLFRYGPYADEHRLTGRGFPYRAVGEFAGLRQLLSPGNVMLESRMMRPSGERK